MYILGVYGAAGVRINHQFFPPIIYAVDAPVDSLQVEREREEWEREQSGEDQAQSRSQRSVSRERWVETMVVADSKLIEYHGSDNVESYIFTIMNMVSVLNVLFI